MTLWQPRLIACDLDGTLLDSHAQITQPTRLALQRAAGMGIALVLCSGRYFPGVRAIALEAGGCRVMVVGNGAQVRTFDGSILFARMLEAAPCLELLDAARACGVTCNVYAGDVIYSDAPNRVLDYYRELNRRLPQAFCCPLEVVDDLARVILEHAGELLKMEVFPVPPALAARLRAMQAAFPQVAFEGSWKTSVEMHAAGVDKGSGLRFAARYLGLPMAATMAFGDGENDVPLLRAAHVGVAMGNAVPQARAAAQVLAPDHDHDGVAQVIARYV